MLEETKKLLDGLICDEELTNYAIRVGRNDTIISDLYSDGVNETTLFDIASVTKILSVTTIALISIDRGILKLSDKVSRFFTVPSHYENLTVKNLLTHTMGIGHKNLTDASRTYDDIAEYILSLYDNEPGSNTAYSCSAFILMGKILEKLYGKRLDALFDEMVAAPLCMERSGFLPIKNNRTDIINSNIEDNEKGIVNDYNCRYLGGVAGNAGVFSCIHDLTLYVEGLLNDGAPLFSKQTLDIAAKNHTEGMNESRGIGFLYVNEKYKQTGNLFPEGSIGHCGHTGTSLFLNRETGIYVIILSDATKMAIAKHGRSYYEKVMKMRENIHNAIKKDLNI